MATQAIGRRPEIAAGAGLVNKYMLPKVALVFIAVASLVGVYLTMRTHGAEPFGILARWVHLVSLATLTGSFMWWGFFTRRSDDSLTHFHHAQERRFAPIAWIALAGVLLSAPHALWFAGWVQESRGPSGFLVEYAPGPAFGFAASLILLAGACACTLGALFKLRMSQSPVKMGYVRFVFASQLLAVAATAVVDALLTFPGSFLASLLRVTHLTAFSLWFGGAVWNIFVAGPASKETLSLPVVRAAAGQLERFRWVVRFVLPTLLLTGLAQALPYTGWSLAALATTTFGRLIALKLGLVAGLVVIFITCPLWRACSPVKGICDLEDLAETPTPAREAVRRLDNRGKGCAGFVHIREELDRLTCGETLEVLSSDPISWWELPAWLEKHGHVLLVKERRGRFPRRYFRFLIEKGRV